MRFGIGHHLIKCITFLCRSTGYTLVGINLYELPMGMFLDEILIILSLQFKGCCLPNIIRGNTDINAYPLLDFIIVKVDGLFFGDVLIFTAVKVRIYPASNPVFSIFFIFSFIYYHSLIPRIGSPSQSCFCPSGKKSKANKSSV